MGILDVKNLKFKYKDIELFNNVEFHLEAKEHIVIVGENGTGKSTFMKLISKNLIPDAGTITWLNHIKYAYLDQHLEMNNDLSINDYLTATFKNLYDKEKELIKLYEDLGTASATDYDKITKKIDIVNRYLEDNNFYAISSTISNVINGLGLNNVNLDRLISSLSGGEKMKVYLAKIILEEPNVLLMDEPTNFLDANQVDWLAKYLKGFNGEFIIISHDESFIANIANVIYELNNKTFVRYKMGYEAYLKEREIRRESYLKAYNAEQKKIKEMETFIAKNIVRATTTKRAQSRRKMLEKMEKLPKPKNRVPLKLNFPFSHSTGDEVLILNELIIGYDKAILGPLNYKLMKEKKIAILGRNGVGKSTLLKTILSQIKPLSGDFKWNLSADINYFRQEENEFDEINAINYLRYFYHLKTDEELRTILARVGIGKDLCLKPIKELSGGERTRVRLALMTMKKSNILILDEPTNHLDPMTKLELFDALKSFPGTVILVSHEKDFYDELVDDEIYFD